MGPSQRAASLGSRPRAGSFFPQPHLHCALLFKTPIPKNPMNFLKFFFADVGASLHSRVAPTGSWGLRSFAFFPLSTLIIAFNRALLS